MRVLVVGSGGREHALAWKIRQSPLVTALLSAPGSDGMADLAQATGVAADDIDGIVGLAQQERIDLAVIGPEQPLADGLADRLREIGFAVFGPSRAAARLEASKQFAKDFMRRHDIPTADYAVFEDLEAAIRYTRDPQRATGCVVKADGLAAGKGVAVCESASEAEHALREIMADRRFGAAGDRVVIEERLVGEEASYYAISDGEHIVTLAAAQDHKRLNDGDRGENTGGMGAYAPATVFTEAVEKRVLERIVHPTIRGMAAEGNPYQGVLYVGLMIDEHGDPRVIEFNVRFGDPETQPLMLQMERDSDLLPLLDAAARGGLDLVAPPRVEGAAVCVVLASGGYPRSFEKGFPIQGLADLAGEPDVVVFHSGTKRKGDHFVTNGGRVLGITARGADVTSARSRAYAAAGRVRFERVHLRRDIARRAVRP